MDELLILFKALAPFGPWGVAVALLMIWVKSLYERLGKLQEQRAEDRKDLLDMAIKMQERLDSQIDKVKDIVDYIKEKA